MSDDKPTKLKVVDSSPELVPSLPSANLVHSSVLENELTGRLHQFDSGIIALQAEIEGQQTAHEKQVADIKDKHETTKRSLLDRIGDLQKGKRMLEAALDIGHEKLPTPPLGG